MIIEVVCSECGHAFRKEIHRKDFAKPITENFIQWVKAQKHVCPDCYYEKKEASEAQEAKVKGYSRPAFLDSTWNGKIYGHGLQKSIYLQGIKVDLTPEQANEVAYYAWEKGLLNKEEFGKLTAQVSVPEFIRGSWNGKLYGNRQCQYIFVDNQRIDLTESQIAEIIRYNINRNKAA